MDSVNSLDKIHLKKQIISKISKNFLQLLLA